jgi:hypothetical protein
MTRLADTAFRRLLSSNHPLSIHNRAHDSPPPPVPTRRCLPARAVSNSPLGPPAYQHLFHKSHQHSAISHAQTPPTPSIQTAQQRPSFKPARPAAFPSKMAPSRRPSRRNITAPSPTHRRPPVPRSKPPRRPPTHNRRRPLHSNFTASTPLQMHPATRL